MNLRFAAHGTSLHFKHPEAAEVCRRAGFAGVEASDGFVNHGSEEEVARIRDIYRAAGVEIHTYHLPFTPLDNIASFYETHRRKAVERIKESLHRAAAAGSRVAIQHPGVCVLDTQVEGSDPYYRALGRSLEALIPVAESLGIVIAVENMQPRGGLRFGSQPEHFAGMHVRFRHPNLGFCFDSGHALLAMRERVGELLEAMKPGLRAFHFNDNGGYSDAHLAPGRGLVNWPEIANVMREIGFNGISCIETPPFAFGPDFTPEAWCELRESTFRLLS